jgi:hypothetical protein
VSENAIYEVRCEQCRTSFAPETRRCVHCGAPLRRGRQVGSLTEDFDPDHPSEETELLKKGPRAAIWVVMALLTAVASMLRTCAE